MNDLEWQAYLDTLSPELADALSHLMERINTVINRDRSRALAEVQHLEQRMDKLGQRLSELTVRLELYEEQRAADVQAEIDRFAAQQLKPERVQELIGVLYTAVARIEALERANNVE